MCSSQILVVLGFTRDSWDLWNRMSRKKWEEVQITKSKEDRNEKRNGRLWNDYNGNENPRKTDIIPNVPCANIKR